MRRELATSVAVVKDLVRRNVPCRLLYSCILSRLLPRLCSTVGGFACGAHRNEKVGEGREILISTRGVN